MTIAEFPTTREAAEASREAGLAVLVGAPNLVLGGSHSGNIAAIDLLRDGQADILSSDYVPASLIEGVFRLSAAEVGITCRRRCGWPRASRAGPSASATAARSRPTAAPTSSASACRTMPRWSARCGAKASGWCDVLVLWDGEPPARSCLRASRRLAVRKTMIGPLAYVMGPSGAGKDSVLERARAMLPPDAPVAFAHRYITRPADVGGENHVALSRAEFALRRGRGLFTYHWHAHGNDYGVGCEIQAWRARPHGRVSRLARAFREGRRQRWLDPSRADHRAARTLAARSPRAAARTRGGAAAGAGQAHEVRDPRLVTIVNDGALDAAADAFVRALARLRCSPGARRRA